VISRAPEKCFLIATAVIESGAGLALLCFPSVAVALLLGEPFDTPAALTVTRVGAAGLLTLGVACWLARRDALSRDARGLADAMAFYNVAAVAVLAYAGIGLGLHGMALWPAVALHTVMVAWCIARFLGKPVRVGANAK
jgi:hypothetical protein